MLVSMDLDTSTEDDIVATYDVANVLIVIKSKPATARGAGEGDDDDDDGSGDDGPATATATATAAATTQRGTGRGVTAEKYANVGLVLWQAGLVAADWIIRHWALTTEDARPEARLAGLRAVVELGCGVGQCGIALAAAGARRVVMTDLPHVVPLAEENVRLNAAALSSGGRRPPVALPFVWGEDAAPVLAALQGRLGDDGGGAGTGAGAKETGEGAGQGGAGVGAGAAEQDAAAAAPAGAAAAAPATAPAPPAHPWPDLVVAADCLYEPRVYPLLLSALVRLSGPDTRCVLCHRMRVYGEGAFEASARAAGLQVRVAPAEELASGYQCGGWRLVELRRRGSEGEGGGGVLPSGERARP